jgi:hypothetical protein
MTRYFDPRKRCREEDEEEEEEEEKEEERPVLLKEGNENPQS